MVSRRRLGLWMVLAFCLLGEATSRGMTNTTAGVLANSTASASASLSTSGSGSSASSSGSKSRSTPLPKRSQNKTTKATESSTSVSSSSASAVSSSSTSLSSSASLEGSGNFNARKGGGDSVTGKEEGKMSTTLWVIYTVAIPGAIILIAFMAFVFIMRMRTNAQRMEELEKAEAAMEESTVSLAKTPPTGTSQTHFFQQSEKN